MNYKTYPSVFDRKNQNLPVGGCRNPDFRSFLKKKKMRVRLNVGEKKNPKMRGMERSDRFELKTVSLLFFYSKI